MHNILKNGLYFLVNTLLQKHKIKLDPEELAFQIQSHPSYPSLHAITGVLNHFNIENIAIRLPVDKETIEQLPTSYLAQIKHNNSTSIALAINKGKNYKIIFSNKKNETISQKAFLEQFTGVLVGVEKDETNNIRKANTVNFQKPLLLIALALVIILFLTSSPSLYASFHFVLSIIGFLISLLIVQHNLGISTKIIDSICSQESKATNCNAVLNSKGATLYKNIKLSDVSVAYFLSVSMCSFLFSLTKTPLTVLYLLSILALPIVVYSIYYQIKIAKSWCALCLSIVSILVLHASIFFFTNSNFSALDIESILLIGVSFTSISSIWLFISSKLKQEQALKKLKIESSKFKKNFDLFNTLLQQAETINTTLVNTPEIILGNKNAPLNITVITNPFCGHCKSVHNLVESILKKHHNALSITVRFNINTSNLESNGVLVSNRLLELFHTDGEIKCLEAMHDIYNNGDAKSWLTKWQKGRNTTNYINSLNTEYKWCLDNKINFTPEILINGKVYPKAYDRKDLIFFIEDLSDCCIEDSKNLNAITLQNTI